MATPKALVEINPGGASASKHYGFFELGKRFRSRPGYRTEVGLISRAAVAMMRRWHKNFTREEIKEYFENRGW